MSFSENFSDGVVAVRMDAEQRVKLVAEKRTTLIFSGAIELLDRDSERSAITPAMIRTAVCKSEAILDATVDSQQDWLKSQVEDVVTAHRKRLEKTRADRRKKEETRKNAVSNRLKKPGSRKS